MTEKKEVEEPKQEKLRCKRCNSAFVYVRIKDKSLICRKCGFFDPNIVL
jgi:ribosomal protein L37AE/L43A